MNKHQKYYARNKAKRKLQIQTRVRSIQEEVRNYKLSKGCSRCGYRKCSRSLQFHHRENELKESEVTRLLSQGASLARLMKEIEKCDLLCANCHGEVHATDKELTDTEASFNGQENGPSPQKSEFDSLRLYQNPKVPQPKTLKPARRCQSCSKLVYRRSTYCRQCNPKAKQQPTKITWPEVSVLKDRVAVIGFSALSRELGVSDNAIRKRISRHV